MSLNGTSSSIDALLCIEAGTLCDVNSIDQGLDGPCSTSRLGLGKGQSGGRLAKENNRVAARGVDTRTTTALFSQQPRSGPQQQHRLHHPRNAITTAMPAHRATATASIPAAAQSRKRPAASVAAPAKRARGSVAVGEKFTTIASVATAFGLSYSELGNRYLLPRADLTPTTYAVPARLPCLMRFMAAHVRHFDRACEAICRTLVDLVLTESLIVLTGGMAEPDAQNAHDAHHTSSVPTLHSSPPAAPAGPPHSRLAPAVLVTGEVTIRWHNPATSTEYTGRADYAVGITAAVVSAATAAATATPETAPYTAFMLLAEAKHAQNVDAAESQLAAYLAILHSHRREVQKTFLNPQISAAVYGFATDGLRYTFMMIDSAGTIKCAERMQLRDEQDARLIVGAVVRILEMELAQREALVRKSRQSSRVSSGASAVSSRGDVLLPADTDGAAMTYPSTTIVDSSQQGSLSGEEMANVAMMELLEAHGMVDEPAVLISKSPYTMPCTSGTIDAPFATDGRSDINDGDKAEDIDHFSDDTAYGDFDEDTS
ncbi:hypothetical protein DFH27DRAFT_639779 [Peziza echinospora]|nr:hypothetical protein DFH27DRAFT_639779 [Peziza echinospora]